jgi:type IV pilus assembly protein PilV
MFTVPNMNMDSSKTTRGFTLIEVLITIIIVSIALLGLAGLQLTSLNSQMESYQRAQAMLLLEDMANRIRANSAEAMVLGVYTLGDQYGLTGPDDCTSKITTAARDLCEWNAAIAGAAITTPDSTNAGSVLGARGCIQRIDGSSYGGYGEVTIRLTIAWQGMSPTKAPPDSVTCGKDQYGSPDSYRRVVRLDTVLADLSLP